MPSSHHSRVGDLVDCCHAPSRAHRRFSIRLHLGVHAHPRRCRRGGARQALVPTVQQNRWTLLIMYSEGRLAQGQSSVEWIVRVL